MILASNNYYNKELFILYLPLILISIIYLCQYKLIKFYFTLWVILHWYHYLFFTLIVPDAAPGNSKLALVPFNMLF